MLGLIPRIHPEHVTLDPDMPDLIPSMVGATRQHIVQLAEIDPKMPDLILATRQVSEEHFHVDPNVCKQSTHSGQQGQEQDSPAASKGEIFMAQIIQELEME